MFLILMVAGLVGLAMMALPAVGRHGHVHHVHHAHHVQHAHHATATARTSLTRFLPSPRAVFSLLALYGAFAYALERGLHLPTVTAALLALVPALAVERLAVTPLWNLLFRFQAAPSSPLVALILTEATAVTTFRNGRGLVSVLRDGRRVQLAARLVATQASLPVRVGDCLRVEDVDAANERVTVALASH